MGQRVDFIPCLSGRIAPSIQSFMVFTNQTVQKGIFHTHLVHPGTRQQGMDAQVTRLPAGQGGQLAVQIVLQGRRGQIHAQRSLHQDMAFGFVKLHQGPDDHNQGCYLNRVRRGVMIGVELQGGCNAGIRCC